MTLVSILVPAHNAERWIGRTIASALAQTWPRKEVIVVDDGSTDQTLRVAKTFESGSVKVVSQSNVGAAGARNAAFKFASGDYIQWLDADDVLHPEKIEQQLALSADHGRSSRLLLTSAWGRFFERQDRARFVPSSLWETLSPTEWIARKLRDNVFMLPATWLVSRDLIESAGLWDERLSLDDDGEYMCRLVAESERVAFVPLARCYYRIGNSSSLSWQKSERALQSAFLSMTLCIEQLLRLEDSARTRGACLTFVQDAFGLYYPEHGELVARCRALAQSLGGDVEPPPERPHFRLFRTLFGWNAAKATRSRIDRSRLAVARWAERMGAGGASTHPH